MSLPEEKFNSLRNSKNFLNELMDPKKTPKVPKHIRKRARACLKHWFFDFEIDQIEEFLKEKRYELK